MGGSRVAQIIDETVAGFRHTVADLRKFTAPSA
jgi:hypothetical protein